MGEDDTYFFISYLLWLFPLKGEHVLWLWYLGMTLCLGIKIDATTSGMFGGVVCAASALVARLSPEVRATCGAATFMRCENAQFSQT